MQRIYAGAFLRALTGISNLGQAMRLINRADPANFDVAEYGELARQASALHDDISALELVAAMVSCQRLKLLFEESGSNVVSAGTTQRVVVSQETVSKIEDLCNETRGRVLDEMQARVFLAIPASKTKLFTSNFPAFGDDVQRKFPSLGLEIEEAAKCLALARHTAAVFHLMRVLEAALRAIARCLGIPDPTRDAERNWGKVLNSINNSIAAKQQAKSWHSSEDYELFNGLSATLNAIRIAWRNTTMHVENVYTEEEADHIMNLTGGLMRTLACRLDQDGFPLA